MCYVIGIDGGGTATKALLADMEGNIIAEAGSGPTNPYVVDIHQLQENIHRLLQQLSNRASASFLQVRRIFAGISGAADASNKELLARLIGEGMTGDPMIHIEPDVINALYAGTFGEPGIIQIAGTGSVTYGINALGEHGRIGGRGYLLDDEGSGYDIGKQGIAAVIKASDGRGPGTLLQDKIYQHFRAADIDGLIHVIYGAASPKEEIAPIARYVMEACGEKDKTALRIVEDASEQIVHSIHTLQKQLFPGEKDVSVVLGGGLLMSGSFLQKKIEEKLNIRHDDFCPTRQELSPEAGSVIGAYILEKLNITDSIKENLSL